MGDLDLMAAEVRCEAATRGPWSFDLYDPAGTRKLARGSRKTGKVTSGGFSVAGHVDDTDGPFIAAARTDLPAALAVIFEAVSLRRLWHDKAGTTDDAYGAAAEAFWKKIDTLSDAYAIGDAYAIANVRAALPAGSTCTDDEARAFLAARGAKLGEGGPW